ncbi:MAG: hypothetical protein MR598_05940 [Erysipelotrichaceae bacterium]|nr:hypothetical protein [Erysipelotrichaceae bacterium]
MKKKKYILVLIVIISSFCFMNNVSAAQELTCLYKTPWTQRTILTTNPADHMIMIQYSDGTIEIYKNSMSSDLEDTRWYQSETAASQANFNDKNLKKDSEGHLKECPQSEERNNGIPIFYGEKDQGKRNLSSSWLEVKRPNLYSNETTLGKYEGEKCINIDNTTKWIEKFDEQTYAAACLYESDTPAGCHIVQINIKENGDFNVLQDEPRKELGQFGFATLLQDVDSLNIDTVKGNYAGYCPSAIYVYRNEVANTEIKVTEITYQITTSVRIDAKKNYVQYGQVEDGVKGRNLVTGEEQSQEVQIPLTFEKINILSCEQLFGENDELIKMIKSGITLVKIAIPIILIGLGIVDFVQAVFSSSEDKMKKAQQKFIKRLIIGVVIFLIPSLLKFILTIANGIWGNIDADLCGLL